MRDRATAEEVLRYREDGFVVIHDLIGPQERAELAAAVAAAVASMGRSKLNGNSAWVEGDGYYDRVFVQRINLWKISPIVRRYMLGAELGRLASELAGVDLRVWHDQTLQKAPWANPTSWHCDVPKWSFSSPDAISVWIALDDATLENGCMHYLPGSHRLVGYENAVIGADMGSLFRLYPALAGIEPVAAPMPAGSCGFHNGLTAHAAGPNMTPRWRPAMTCAYMPAGSTFNGNPNVLPHERLSRLRVGDSLDDDQENPLVSPHAVLTTTR